MRSRIPKWQRITTKRPPGVIVAHEAWVSGFYLKVELVMTGAGYMVHKVNGTIHGEPIYSTRAEGRRRHRRLLKTFRVRQSHIFDYLEESGPIVEAEC